MSPSLVSLTLLFLSFSCLVSSLDLYYEGESSIISDNVVDPSWKPGAHGITIDAWTSTTSFWLIASEYNDEEIGDIELYVHSGADICVPSLVVEPGWELEDYYDYFSDDYYYYANEEIFDVNYECKKKGVAEFRLVIPVGSLKLEIAWEKSCGGGVRAGIKLGTEQDLADMAQDGEVVNEWATGDHIIPSSSSFSTFYLSTSQGAQSYSADVVSNNPKIVEVHVRGAGGVPNVVSHQDESHDITILYNCLKHGTSVIKMVLDVPPFQPMQLKWTKSCGGEIEGGVNVGLSRTTAGVMRDGELVESFSKFIAKATDRHTDFYIYLDQEGIQRFDGMLVTTDSGNVLRPYLELNGKKAESGFLTQDPQKISIYYNCLKKGDATVTVTLIFPPYKMEEFSWQKRCVRLTPLADENVWTTNQLIVLFVVLSLAMFGIFLALKNYRTSKKK